MGSADRLRAAELEGTGVNLISVDPGEMATRMHRDALPDADPSTLARPENVATAILSGLARLTPRDSARRFMAADWGPS